MAVNNDFSRHVKIKKEVKDIDKKVDFLTKDGINWLSANMFSDSVEIQKGKKDISQDRNQALFKIIKEGGIISKGELFSKLEQLINN